VQSHQGQKGRSNNVHQKLYRHSAASTSPSAGLFQTYDRVYKGATNPRAPVSEHWVDIPVDSILLIPYLERRSRFHRSNELGFVCIDFIERESSRSPVHISSTRRIA
jgi:hypothetical protein